MKKIISKLLSVLIACSFVMLSIPFTVNAAYTEEINGIVYKTGNGGLIVTDITDTSASKVIIPNEKITLKTGVSLSVVGISDYAFGYCNNLTEVHVPSSLKKEAMGNSAFLTAKAVADYINNEVGSISSKDYIKYIARQIYGDQNFTNEQLQQIEDKINDKLSMIDVSGSQSNEDKLMTFIKNIDQMGLNSTTLMKFNIWISAVKYSSMTIKGADNTYIKDYVTAREPLGLKYDVTYTYKLNDNGCELYYKPISSNNDGKNDGISIIGYSGNISSMEIPEKIENLPVIDIADNAFSDAQNLNTLTIPKYVENIGNNAVGYQNGFKVSDFTIIGYSGTNAERYALINSIKFIDIQNVPKLSNTELELKQNDLIGIQLINYVGNVKWVSSDTSIATVESADGGCEAYINAKSKGEVTIYAIFKYTGNEEKILECKVTVIGNPILTTATQATKATTSAEPPVSITTKSTVTSVTTLEPAISITSKLTSASSTTTLEPAISIKTDLTTSSSVVTSTSVNSSTSSNISTSNSTTSTVLSIVTSTEVSEITICSSSTTSLISSETSDLTTNTSISTTTLTSSETSDSATDTSASTTTLTSAETSDSATDTSASTTTLTSSETSDSTTDTSASTTTLTSSETSDSTTDTSASTTLMTSTNVSDTTTETVTSSCITTNTTYISTSTSHISSILNTSVSVSTSMSDSQTSITSSSTSSSTTSAITTTEAIITKQAILGDANDSGTVNIVDAAFIAKKIAQRQTHTLPVYADFNQDGVINIIDAAEIAKAVAKRTIKNWIKVTIIIR